MSSRSISRCLIPLLLGAACLPAQVAFTFVEQPSRIPGVAEYHVWARNGASQPMVVDGAQVIAEAEGRKLNFISYVNLKRVLDDANRRSPAHWVTLAVEFIGTGSVIVEAAGGLKIKEAKYRALIPDGSVGLRLVREVV